MRAQWFNYGTGCHVMGTTRSGKSKFAEYCIREHILSRRGVAVLDFGTLAEHVFQFICYVKPRQKVVYLNFSGPDAIVPFNPFLVPERRDLSAHASRLTELLAKVWGMDGANEMPQSVLVSQSLESTARLLFRLCAVTKIPLRRAIQLLDYRNTEFRNYALHLLGEDESAEQWASLNALNEKDWMFRVQPLQPRLERFIASKAVLRFMGMPETLDIDQIIDEGAILLVNLRPSADFPIQSGRLVAAVLLDQFFQAAMERAHNPKEFYLYCDECQNYLTGDAAAILDQTVKCGLRCTFLHHHLRQKAFLDHPEIADSLDMNARIKVIFQGLPVPEAKRYAEQFHYAESVNDWIRRENWHSITTYELEDYFTESENDSAQEGSGNGSTSYGERSAQSKYENTGTGHTSSFLSGTRYAPRHEMELASVDYYSRDDKIATLALPLMSLKRQQCYVNLPDRSFVARVPYVRDYLLSETRLLELRKALQSNAIPLDDADRILKEQETLFLERSREYAKSHRAARKARTLSPQH